MKLINETDVNFQLKHNNAGAYTLVEVLAASVILLMGVSAVLCLSSGTISQEEATRKVARGYCIQENAAQLYYLGLSPDEILKLLPIGVSEMEVNITDPKAVKINDIFMEVATVNVQLKSGPNDLRNALASKDFLNVRKERALTPINVYRPIIR